LNYSRTGADTGAGRKKRHLVVYSLFLTVSLIVVSGVCIHFLTNRTQHNEDARILNPSSTSNTAYLLEAQRAPQIQARGRRLIYPYSIVPGGISSAEDLRNAAAHDGVVATHFSGFNYRRARLIEVKQPQKVYLSYRLHNKVYWTVRQASLHVGEKLLTDGTLTARTRCGNQVSVLPRVASSPDEPPLAELDRPDAMASGIEGFPAALNSKILNVDPGLPIGPATSGVPVPGGGTPPGVFVPPPIGGGGFGGGGGTGGGSGGGGGPGGGGGGGHPPATPEPGTILLVLSGAGIIFARYRKS
jgi:hypothetical protein